MNIGVSTFDFNITQKIVSFDLRWKSTKDEISHYIKIRCDRIMSVGFFWHIFDKLENSIRQLVHSLLQWW